VEEEIDMLGNKGRCFVMVMWLVAHTAQVWFVLAAFFPFYGRSVSEIGKNNSA
jgi:hypothetical protein